jgi:hypothetical protein
MDETVEEDVTEEIKEKEIKESEEIKQLKQKLETPSKVIEEENKPIPVLHDKSKLFNKKDEILPEKLEDSDDEDTNIKFNDVDMIRDIHNNDNQVLAPKTFERLDEISNIRNEQRKLEDSDDSDDDENELVKLKISDNISNNHLGIELLEPEILDESENLLSEFIEELH